MAVAVPGRVAYLGGGTGLACNDKLGSQPAVHLTLRVGQIIRFGAAPGGLPLHVRPTVGGQGTLVKLLKHADDEWDYQAIKTGQLTIWAKPSNMCTVKTRSKVGCRVAEVTVLPH